MGFDEELLIDLIRAHRYLYDPVDIHYHNIVKKDSTWEEIARTLRYPANECKKKWTSLRDCYRKAMRHRKSKSDQNPTNYKPWKFEEHMAFLIPFINEREQKANLSQTTFGDVINNSDDDNDGGNGPDCEPEVTIGDNIYIGSNSNSTPMVSTSMCTSIGHQPQSPAVGNSLKPYFDHRQAPSRYERRPDHLRKFFDAMEETVRTFHPQLQIEIKGKISALVTEYELKNLLEQHPPIQSQYYVCDGLKQE